MDKQRIGRRIKSYRKLKRFTQRQFADELDVSVGLLSSLERGEKLTTDELLTKISSVLQVELGELLGKDCQDKDR